jgi:hypothetical protein
VHLPSLWTRPPGLSTGRRNCHSSRNSCREQGPLADYSKEHQVTRPSADDNTVAKTDRATLPKKIPPTARIPQPIKQSAVCNQHRKRWETVYQCPKYLVPLCTDEWYQVYHAKNNCYGNAICIIFKWVISGVSCQE